MAQNVAMKTKNVPTIFHSKFSDGYFVGYLNVVKKQLDGARHARIYVYISSESINYMWL